METREVGSKNWFQEKSIPTNSNPINTINKEISDLFNQENDAINAHISYNSVTHSADACYIYRRKEADILAENYCVQLCRLPEIIWLKYSDIIMPMLINNKSDSIVVLEEISKINIFNVISKDLDTSLVGPEACNAFFSTFDSEITADKNKFISEISKIINLEEYNRVQLTNEICKEFGNKFLETIISEESVSKDSSKESGNEHAHNDSSEGSSNNTNKDICSNIASHISKVIFFKMPLKFSCEDITNIGNKLRDGRIYQLPNGSHNWLNNLSWLLAHIHKGNTFVIFSDLTEDVMLRKSSGHEDDLSGFAREIALLMKLNYQIIYKDSFFMLLPPQSLHEIENIHVKDAYISDIEEVKKYYGQAVETYSKLKNQVINSSPDNLHPVNTDLLLNKTSYTTSIFAQSNEKINNNLEQEILHISQTSTSSIVMELSGQDQKIAITGLNQKTDISSLTNERKRPLSKNSNENNQSSSESEESRKKKKEIHDATSDEEQAENKGNQSFLPGNK